MGATTVAVPGIHCDHCKASIEGALRTLDGVRSAEVSVAHGMVSVEYDESVVDVERIRETIADQGYDLTD